MLCSVARGELDVIFVTGAPDVTGLASEKLWTESIFVALPSMHALADRNIVSWDDLSAETFVLNARGPGAEIEDYLIRMLARPGFRPKVEMHDVARDSLLTMVGMGFGITITSASSIRRELAGVVFLPIEGEKDALWSSAVWSKGPDNLLLKRFLEYASRFAASWNDSLSREGI
jgi:DNA-binding transcriptional LysR family regulator